MEGCVNMNNQMPFFHPNMMPPQNFDFFNFLKELNEKIQILERKVNELERKVKNIENTKQNPSSGFKNDYDGFKQGYIV